MIPFVLADEFLSISVNAVHAISPSHNERTQSGIIETINGVSDPTERYTEEVRYSTICIRSSLALTTGKLGFSRRSGLLIPILHISTRGFLRSALSTVQYRWSEKLLGNGDLRDRSATELVASW